MRRRQELQAAPPGKLDWTFHRQYELYRDRSRLTSRLAVLAVGVAALLLFKVVEPFHAISVEVAKKATAIASLEDARVQASLDEEKLRGVTGVYGRVTDILASEPWREIGSELENDARRLDESYSRLIDTGIDELRKALESVPDVPVMVGSAAELNAVRPRPAAFVQWVEPPKPPLTPEPEPAPAEEPVDDVFTRARQRLGKLGLPLPGRKADASSMPVIEALELMQIDPARVADADSFRERDELLFERYRERITEEADEAVAAMVALARNSVIDPLIVTGERAHGRTGSDPLERFEREVTEWARPYRKGEGWYEELRAEPALALELASSFETVLAAIAPDIRRESVAATGDWEEARLHSRELGEELGASIQERDALLTRGGELLPVWIGELISPSHLMQVYPAIVCFLVLLAALSAWRAREHFLRFREGITGAQEYAQLHAVSSAWTLVRRGTLGTLWTLLLFLGCTTAAWLAFERGAGLMTEWSGLPAAQPWPFVVDLAEAMPWFGRAFFLAAGGGVLLTLFVEDGREEQLTAV